MDRHRVAREDRHPHAGDGYGELRDAEDLAALVAHLLLFVGLTAAIVDDRSGERNDVERDGRGELLCRRELDGASVEGQRRGAVAHLALLLVELVDPDTTGTRHRLIRVDDDATKNGFAMQRGEHSHERHRRAVRVGDDALRDVVELVVVHIGDNERNVGIHAPRGRVVDHDRAGRSNAGTQVFGGVLACGEQSDIEPVVVGRLGFLDDDLAVTPRQRAARGTGGCEVAKLIDRKGAVGQQLAHDTADLTRRPEDTNTHGATGYDPRWCRSPMGNFIP